MILNLIKKKKYNYDKLIKNINENNIQELRRRIKILIVDDEKYDIFDNLITRGYNVFYKNDITYMEEAEPFDFLILDIQGICNKFGGPHGGFSYAKEIKKLYPHKIVICYTGTTTNMDINESIDKIDKFVKKGTDTDKWCDILDDKISEYSKIDYHWNVTRKILTEKGINIKKINKIEKLYINSFKNSNYDDLIAYLRQEVSDVNLILETVLFLFNISKIFL